MEATNTSETETIEVPEFIREYLEPIPGASPAGSDISNEEEFFKLNMEIPKTAPDYKKCIELSDIILKEKSKDIKVAAWLCFALFRTEKIKGLKDGLNLIYHLLIKYGNELFPNNALHRSKALQFLNTTRFFKLVEKEEITRSNANDIIEADSVLTQIINESKKLFPENIPILKSFKEVIAEQAETAKSLIIPPKKEDKIPEIKKDKIEDNKADVLEGSQVRIDGKPKPQTVQPAKELKLTSEKDAIKQLRQTLLFFFEKDIDGTKKEQVPESHFVFGFSRQLQWGKLIKPPDADKVTQIEAPNQIIQNKIKELYSSSNWDALIPRIEINFLKPDGEFPYWLDTQRYITKALEEKGGNFAKASQEIKMHLAMLLNKIPDLPQLKFKDKQTPFADDETKKWIEDEVKSVLSGGSSSMILPPIIGEDYEAVNKEYEEACNQLPNNFEENLNSMQKGILSDERRKGKFLRRLNIANFCFKANHFNLARINLLELKKLIDEFNLNEWEPALSTSVWQSLYITNSKLFSNLDKDDSKLNIEKEQQELFSKIAKYDGLLALKLINNKS